MMPVPWMAVCRGFHNGLDPSMDTVDTDGMDGAGGVYLDVPDRKEVNGSKVIGSMGYFTPRNTPFISRL